MPAIYIRLLVSELEQLTGMADEERRSPQEQAAVLVSRGLREWQATKDLEQLLLNEEGVA
jgi:hypothetical protein